MSSRAKVRSPVPPLSLSVEKMKAEHHATMSSREGIMSDDKIGDQADTMLTDSPAEIGIDQEACARNPRISGANRAIARQDIVQEKGRIHVIEPDDLIRGLLERWLGEAGYTVVVED